jgi:hypothetical protein
MWWPGKRRTEAKEKRMDFSSVPEFPVVQKPGSAVCALDEVPLLPPRLTRVLFDLGILAAIGALVYVLWWMATVVQETPVRPPAQPQISEPEARTLPFQLVWEKFPRVKTFDCRTEVTGLLGSPTRWVAWEPALNAHEQQAEEFLQRNKAPLDRIWGKWIDTFNERKWVAVLFAGGKVYWTARSQD